MNRFDESKIRRASDGKFATKPHSEADVDLRVQTTDTHDLLDSTAWQDRRQGIFQAAHYAVPMGLLKV